MSGFTLAEVLTVLVVMVVLVALAIPMWRNHVLRVQRTEGRAALFAIQTAEDRFFGQHARYASGAEIAAPPPEGLGIKAASERGYYDLDVRTSGDGLAFTATARSGKKGSDSDPRCVEFSLDQNGRRRARDSQGNDRSADCWS